jgi:hypothetical protein
MHKDLAKSNRNIFGLTDVLGNIHVKRSVAIHKSDPLLILHLLFHEFGHRIRMTALRESQSET